MAVPDVPVGMLAKAALWLGDFFRMPTRIRLLAEGAAADADARPKCAACGVGRVPSLGSLTQNGVAYSLGRCVDCGAGWVLTGPGDTLRRRIMPGDRLPDGFAPE